MEAKQLKAYEMYKKNINLTQIATTLGVTRQTVANWKNRYKWNDMLLSEHTIDADLKEKEFLIELIKEWDKTLEEIKDSDLTNKLTILEKFTKTYYKLKNTKEQSTYTQKLKKEEIIKQTIKNIANLALETKNIKVASFLSDNADNIIRMAND